MFALVRGHEAARELADGIRSIAGDRPLALWHTPASARGAIVHTAGA